ncbi:MAG: hypothetical protein MJZ11_02505 [Lachnospiraceae bacterium]|nr:hypothetical protein [Lachnospiraceae bacterium]
MNEQNLKLEKVKKSCNVIGKVLLFFKILMIIGIVGCAIGAITSSVIGNDGLKLAFEQEEGTIGDMRINFGNGLIVLHSDEFIEEGNYLLLILLNTIAGAIVCAIGLAFFTFIGRVFKTIEKSETPFCDEVIKSLKISFIVLSIFIAVASGLGTGAITALVCWCLYTIFQYGYVLQKEADETI